LNIFLNEKNPLILNIKSFSLIALNIFICHRFKYKFTFHSIGRSLRTLAEAEPKPLTENYAIKESLVAGEMVNKESIEKLLHSNIVQLQSKKGIIIDGYPRDINQVQDFEEKVFS
jgi:adenylate kinase family enzyme